MTNTTNTKRSAAKLSRRIVAGLQGVAGCNYASARRYEASRVKSKVDAKRAALGERMESIHRDIYYGRTGEEFKLEGLFAAYTALEKAGWAILYPNR